MREKMDLDASEKYALILKNLGGCLIERKRESAKLQNVWLKRAYTSLAIAYDLVQKKSEAVYYAKISNGNY